MWIKRGNEIVNTDSVQSIEKNYWSVDGKRIFIIRFNQVHNTITFEFETEKVRDEYLDALLEMIGAQEVPLLKI
jgi:hypothetical protein